MIDLAQIRIGGTPRLSSRHIDGKIVTNDIGLMIGDVFELVRGTDVAEGEHSGDRLAVSKYALTWVDAETSVIKNIETGCEHIQTCGVRCPSSGDEDRIRVYLRGQIDIAEATACLQRHAQSLV